MIHLPPEFCPKCHNKAMKSWRDLTDDQKFIVERLPRAIELKLAELKKQRFCERCWFSDNPAVDA